MKKIVSFLMMLLLCGSFAMAQNNGQLPGQLPEGDPTISDAPAAKFNYQAVLRHNTTHELANELVRNQSGTATFTAGDQVIAEDVAFTTTDNGMVSVLIESPADFNWRGVILIATFTLDADGEEIVIETPVTAVPYAVHAETAVLTTDAIVRYLDPSNSDGSDMNRIYQALKANSNLHDATRDTLVQFIKDNYELAKKVAYSYLHQITPDDLYETYDVAHNVDPAVKQAVYNVIKDYLKSHRNLLLEVAEYYLRDATEAEVDELHDALEENTNVAGKVRTILYKYFESYLKRRGLWCEDHTVCDIVDIINNNTPTPPTPPTPTTCPTLSQVLSENDLIFTDENNDNVADHVTVRVQIENYDDRYVDIENSRFRAFKDGSDVEFTYTGLQTDETKELYVYTETDGTKWLYGTVTMNHLMNVFPNSDGLKVQLTLAYNCEEQPGIIFSPTHGWANCVDDVLGQPFATDLAVRGFNLSIPVLVDPAEMGSLYFMASLGSETNFTYVISDDFSMRPVGDNTTTFVYEPNFDNQNRATAFASLPHDQEILFSVEYAAGPCWFSIVKNYVPECPTLGTTTASLSEDHTHLIASTPIEGAYDLAVDQKYVIVAHLSNGNFATYEVDAMGLIDNVNYGEIMTLGLNGFDLSEIVSTMTPGQTLTVEVSPKFTCSLDNEEYFGSLATVTYTIPAECPSVDLPNNTLTITKASNGSYYTDFYYTGGSGNEVISGQYKVSDGEFQDLSDEVMGVDKTEKHVIVAIPEMDAQVPAGDRIQIVVSIIENNCTPIVLSGFYYEPIVCPTFVSTNTVQFNAESLYVQLNTEVEGNPALLTTPKYIFSVEGQNVDTLSASIDMENNAIYYQGYGLDDLMALGNQLAGKTVLITPQAVCNGQLVEGRPVDYTFPACVGVESSDFTVSLVDGYYTGSFQYTGGNDETRVSGNYKINGGSSYPDLLESAGNLIVDRTNRTVTVQILATDNITSLDEVRVFLSNIYWLCPESSITVLGYYETPNPPCAAEADFTPNAIINSDGLMATLKCNNNNLELDNLSVTAKAIGNEEVDLSPEFDADERTYIFYGPSADETAALNPTSVTFTVSGSGMNCTAVEYTATVAACPEIELGTTDVTPSGTNPLMITVSTPVTGLQDVADATDYGYDMTVICTHPDYPLNESDRLDKNTQGMQIVIDRFGVTVDLATILQNLGITADEIPIVMNYVTAEITPFIHAGEFCEEIFGDQVTYPETAPVTECPTLDETSVGTSATSATVFTLSTPVTNLTDVSAATNYGYNVQVATYISYLTMNIPLEGEMTMDESTYSDLVNLTTDELSATVDLMALADQIIPAQYASLVTDQMKAEAMANATATVTPFITLAGTTCGVDGTVTGDPATYPSTTPAQCPTSITGTQATLTEGVLFATATIGGTYDNDDVFHFNIWLADDNTFEPIMIDATVNGNVMSLGTSGYDLSQINYDFGGKTLSVTPSCTCSVNTPAQEEVTTVVSATVYVPFTSPVDGRPCPSAPTMSDGVNTYNTVQIGNQCWMAENMRAIPANATDGSTSLGYNNNTPYYYVYNNQTYYNWPAASVVCPTGWHLPSADEWTELTTYLSNAQEGGEYLYRCNQSLSTSVAKALASTDGWNPSDGTCYPGDQTTKPNNDSGFGAYPAGYFFQSDYYNTADKAQFWTSTVSYNTPSSRALQRNSSNVMSEGGQKNYGLTVRCVKDND